MTFSLMINSPAKNVSELPRTVQIVACRRDSVVIQRDKRLDETETDLETAGSVRVCYLTCKKTYPMIDQVGMSAWSTRIREWSEHDCSLAQLEPMGYSCVQGQRSITTGLMEL